MGGGAVGAGGRTRVSKQRQAALPGLSHVLVCFIQTCGRIELLCNDFNEFNSFYFVKPEIENYKLAFTVCTQETSSVPKPSHGH